MANEPRTIYEYRHASFDTTYAMTGWLNAKGAHGYRLVRLFDSFSEKDKQLKWSVLVMRESKSNATFGLVEQTGTFASIPEAPAGNAAT